MKLPRWLVIAMLAASGLALLAAAGYWWVTWPQRTAQHFHDLLRDWRLAELSSIDEELLQDLARMDEQTLKEWELVSRSSRLEFYRRTILDLILARRDFRIIYDDKPGSLDDFTAERGKVRNAAVD